MGACGLLLPALAPAAAALDDFRDRERLASLLEDLADRDLPLVSPTALAALEVMCEECVCGLGPGEGCICMFIVFICRVFVFVLVLVEVVLRVLLVCLEVAVVSIRCFCCGS